MKHRARPNRADAAVTQGLTTRARLRDMLADGRVMAGELVYMKKHPEQQARIVDGETVEYEGKLILINAWGQKITGWPSINIYTHVCLLRTHQTLDTLRKGQAIEA